MAAHHSLVGVVLCCMIFRAAAAVGGVRCWGRNLEGQATVPSTVIGNVPTGSWSHALPALGAGGYHTCVMTNDNTRNVRCWGSNTYGQIDVSKMGSGVQALGLALGMYHTCALTNQNNAIKCWGDGTYAQTNSPSMRNPKAISSGFYHGCAITTDYNIRCWGAGSTTNKGQATVPTSSPNFATGGIARAVAAGGYHTCALEHITATNADMVRCWGDNSKSQLNIALGATDTPASQITSGAFHSCAVVPGLGIWGTIFCWGSNSHGQITVPADLKGEIDSVEAFGNTTCALTHDKQVVCWGDDTYRQVRDVVSEQLPNEVQEISAGGWHVCTRINDYNECLVGSPCGAAGNCTNTLGSYTCSCKAGWAQTADLHGCVDVNECAAGTDACSNDATCTNTNGSYTCTCNAGYSGTGFTCTDINECTSGTPCGAHGTCNNTDGGYTCNCNSGWLFQNGTCIEEKCNPVCDIHATCDPIPAGNYTCNCAPGWTGTGRVCTDVNECTAGTPCGVGGTCANSAGSYTCNCTSGWTFANGTCRDVDECALSAPCGLNGNCTNSAGSYSCSCTSGYTFANGTCVDVDECSVNATLCGGHGTCVNQDGAYTCECAAGWTLSGGTCTDVDECPSLPCGDHGNCTNTMGGYTCSCKTGWSFTDGTCLDTNECLAVPSPCGGGSTCVNAEGSYTCTCPSGFNYTGASCTDFDECSAGAPCGAHGTCTNSPGWYTCSCAAGWTFDNKTCVDTNECMASPCGASGTCTNSNGSYSCTCQSGWTFNNVTCVDIDECAAGAPCGANGTCNNTNGGYACSCNAGFAFSSGTCTDTDECAAGSPCGANGNCTNTQGGYTCACDAGWTYLNGTCAAEAITCSSTSPPCGPNGTCSDLPDGTYACSCDPGYSFTNGTCTAITCSSTPPPCGPNGTCGDLPDGTYTCSCDPGYSFTNATCTADACSSTPPPCGDYGTCNGLPDGTYDCSCYPGYLFANGTCEATTEGCNSIPPPCGDHGWCSFLPDGNYSCTCDPGYSFLDGTCQVDPVNCSSTPPPCGPNGTCGDLPDGTYTCTCDQGYSFTNGTCQASPISCNTAPPPCGTHGACSDAPGGGYSCSCNVGYSFTNGTCTDYDECAAGSPCGVRGRCTNTDGAYTCACDAGFSFIRGTCVPTVPNQPCNATADPCGGVGTCIDVQGGGHNCTCQAGYTFTSGTCVDIDECTTGSPCGAHGACQNTLGGYTCACDAGYVFSGGICMDAGSSCSGAVNPCGQGTCSNLAGGGYVCTCNAGWEFAGGTCQDVDECSTGRSNCNTNAVCTNTPGGFTCSCKQGYVGNGLQCLRNTTSGGGGVDECAADLDNCSPNATCIDTLGGFRCECNPGYQGDGVTCSPAPSGSCQLLDGILFRHGELRDVAENGRAAASAQECCDRCKATAGCQYFTFNKRTLECWLKGAQGVVQMEFEGTISGSVPGAPSVPRADDSCITELNGKQEPGAWDLVSATCVPLVCKQVDNGQLPAGCQELQCRWGVNVVPELAISTEACGAGTATLIKYNCMQLQATGQVRDSCIGAAAGGVPHWAEVLVVDNNYRRAWVPLYNVTDSGPMFFIDACGATHCDYKQSPTFNQTAATMGHVTADDFKGVKSFVAGPPNAAAPGDPGTPLPNVTVYFHVTTPKKAYSKVMTDQEAAAYVTDVQIQKQVDLMNTVFNPFGITFQVSKKGKKKIKVDRKSITNAKLYGASMAPGSDAFRKATELIWSGPKKNKSTGKKTNHVPTDLHVIVNRLAQPMAVAMALPWEIRSVDAEDMRKPDAKHDVIVMDHDCFPDSQSGRFTGDTGCGKTALGKPWEGYILIKEVAHWLGLGDTYGVADIQSEYSLANGNQVHKCNPVTMDGVTDTPDHWCPTNGCNLDPQGRPQCQSQAGVTTTGYLNEDPRCAGVTQYPDPLNIMNYYWFVGGCKSSPRFTSGQGEKLRELYYSLRVHQPYALADSMQVMPSKGQRCAQWMTGSPAGYNKDRAKCATVTACTNVGGKSLPSWATLAGPEMRCEGPADTVQCCLPSVCKTKSNKAGYCSVKSDCQGGAGAWYNVGLKVVCPSAGGMDVGCCVPQKSKFKPLP